MWSRYPRRKDALAANKENLDSHDHIRSNRMMTIASFSKFQNDLFTHVWQVRTFSLHCGAEIFVILEKLFIEVKSSYPPVKNEKKNNNSCQ